MPSVLSSSGLTSPSPSKNTQAMTADAHSRLPSLDFSDDATDDIDQDDHPGDYSTRMEELFDDDEEVEHKDVSEGEVDSEDDGGFVYNGADAGQVDGTYDDRLRDILDTDPEDDDEVDKVEVERSLLHDAPDVQIEAGMKPEVRHDLQGQASYLNVGSRTNTPSPLSMQLSLPFTPPRMNSPMQDGSPSILGRPFLHPTVSRLRSYVPRSSGVPSTTSADTIQSQFYGNMSPAPSHFSALSPTLSATNLRALSEKHEFAAHSYDESRREVFRWTQLRKLGQYIFSKVPHKASTILGSAPPGSPTVLAANGLICVGTDTGRVYVFDFKQTLKWICGDANSEKTVGPVTALALSNDHSFVAVGHAFGHIQLFDLAKPQTPVRFVPPTSLAAVASGRKEGHLLGSRIVNVDFVAGRHTAIVSADDIGLAFYHSLGKVLFVDASDVLRILGKYPDEDPPVPPHFSLPKMNGTPAPPPPVRRRRSRKANTILAMAPLPLGTAPHATDAYNVVALLTAAKLVIVGLRPSPKTWYRRHRSEDDEQMGKSKYRAALAWFPSVFIDASKTAKKGEKIPPAESTVPLLVYSWGSSLNLIRVSESKTTEKSVNQKTGKTTTIEVGHLTFQEAASWSAQDDVLAIQWLNPNQIVVVTASTLSVFDVRTSQLVEQVHFDASTLASPTLASTASGAVSFADARSDVAHSVRTYKGKMFFLGPHEVQVGMLLTWADRILTLVDEGDFLNAIDLARSYYLGTARGNKNGLPDDAHQLKAVVGERIRQLMAASTQYAFSEERMTDATHITPDGRGVDRTSLFESLTATCTRACIALDDFDFLYEDLFQSYDDAGIARIYLEQLETFILNGDIQYVPPRITQRLIAMHSEDDHPDHAERVIWHIDPECLDINQAIGLCQKYQLYDALIYVYTRALKDYVSPLVELLGLIRKVMQDRRERLLRSESSSPSEYLQETMRSTVLNAYKIFPYLAAVLCGLTYPSEEPLDPDESFTAKRDIYTFLFFGRSSVWPLGEDGKLVFTADEEGGVEPTYPYCRLLLRFDAEAFLHSLDMAFEDPYLNDETQGVTRLIIVKILLELVSTPNLSNADITFVNIFIARNVPKYPQFIQIPPSALHNILIGLARDPDQSTREDRQLAAEYLLSVYTPHESDRILRIFEEAHFYRILRSWYSQEQQWAPLFLAYVHDPDLHTAEIFRNADAIFQKASQRNDGHLPSDLLAAVSDSLQQLLDASIVDASSFLDNHAPQFHEQALACLDPNATLKRFAYLRHLLGPASATEEEDSVATLRGKRPSLHVPQPLRQLYISLQCQVDAAGVIPALEYLPRDFLDWDDALRTCEEHEVFDAVVWALDWRGDSASAMSKLEAFNQKLISRVCQAMPAPIEPWTEFYVQDNINPLRALVRMGTSICLQHSRAKGSDVPVEELWFQLLHIQIESVQSAMGCCFPEALSIVSDDSPETETLRFQRQTLDTLRALVQETFLSLISVSSSRRVSFPSLFKRLVDASSKSAAGTPYTEFRTILTSMLETYRSDGDMLIITKHLVERDIFETVEVLTRERAKGWVTQHGTCMYCRKPLLSTPQTTDGSAENVVVDKIVVSRTGIIYHRRCAPSDPSPSIVHYDALNT